VSDSRTEVLTWDWRQQPDLARLARILLEVSGGTVHLAEVDTGSDEYAIVLSGRFLSEAEVDAAYRATWDVDGS
jgi:hypothetical protein